MKYGIQVLILTKPPIMKKSNNRVGFLFGANSGGCNGFNFDLKLIEEQKLEELQPQKPNVFEQDVVKVYVDPMSELYLIGSEIDFLHEDYTKGIFESKFVYNVDKTNASTCGCGVSFAPKKGSTSM